MISRRTLTLIAAVLVAAATASAQEAERQDTLQTSYVTAVKEKMRNTTQTGLTRLDGEKLRGGVAVFGTPDIIKSLQMLPGVAAGNELMSGLYVHGGDGNDNLFLLDGIPLYNIAHFGGFFSSFNTDIVDNLDFYKSGFPARYGGRLSSVVDVETSEGNMNAYHGNLSLGLIDGRVQIEGPIVKGKTSFNFGVRRSWMDVVTVPLLWYLNSQNGDSYKVNGGYAMTDLNGRITHRFSKDSKLNFTVYWGNDYLRAGLDDKADGLLSIGMGSQWGTLATGLTWDCKYSDKLHGRLLGYYSRSASDIGYDFGIETGAAEDFFSMSMSDHNRCAVHDAGLKYDLDWYPDSFNHVRFGAATAYHNYSATRNYKSERQLPGMDKTSDENTMGVPYHAFEPALYIEDEIFLAYNFTLNAGLRASMFTMSEKTWFHLEPRAALKWLITKDICAKLSYTRMTQNAHLVSAMYIELPTNSWMPSTPGAGPMVSDQVAGGLYFTPGSFRINIEGWYKTMDNMLSYNGANAFYPPLTNWENSFTSGRGRSYGMEFEATWARPKVELSAYYTLCWTWREFEAYYAFPFPDRNDNRHKINLVGTLRPFNGWSFFFNWNYHSGNRITLPSHVLHDEQEFGWLGSGQMLYQAPYNMALPDYHRLDVGVDYRHKLTDRVSWNINLSIYNVYNHKNATFAMLSTDDDDNYIGMAYGLIPIIPTISAGIRF